MSYHQIKIIDFQQKFTAFEANGKLYKFTRIPFGVKKGVAAFQRKIMQFIKEKRLRNTFPYLDNVTVAGHTKKERDKNVKAFLDAVKRRNFTLKESKTVASQNSISILGYVVGNGQAKLDRTVYVHF